MKPNNPASSKAVLTASPSSIATSFTPKSVNCCSLSAFTFTQSTLRRLPRTTAETVPLTGEANLITGSFLLTNKASPALITSPSRTTTFGVMPTKSSGTSAYSSLGRSSVFTSLALPFRLMSKPLRNLITFTIITVYFLKIQLIPLVIFQSRC